MKRSSKIKPEVDQDILHNLRIADKIYKAKLTEEPYENQTEKDWIRMVNERNNPKDKTWSDELMNRANQNLRKQKLIKGSWTLLGNIGAILAMIFIIFMLFSYYAYVAHWFVNIFTGKCFWWSLGFLCTSG